MKKLIGTALLAFVLTLVPVSVNASAADATSSRPHLQSRHSLRVASARKNHKHRRRHHKRAGRTTANSAA